MKKVLFVCVHNSARSQMAEALLNNLAPEYFQAESAGLEPGIINPFVLEAMQEIGYDLSNNKTDSVFEFFKEGRTYSYVIKVCDEINGQRCPIFPRTLKYLNWNIQDPAEATGTHEEKLQKTRDIRDEIHRKVTEFIKTYS